jgi:hypothetical protein
MRLLAQGQEHSESQKRNTVAAYLSGLPVCNTSLARLHQSKQNFDCVYTNYLPNLVMGL